MLKQTPLYPVYAGHGAKVIDFGGWALPVQFAGGIRKEHEAVRQRAGLFDVSHMGEVRVSGRGALDFLQRLTTNDVSKLTPGQCQYSLMCNPDGGVIDDLLVYRLAAETFMLVINAANIAKDMAWMREQLAEEARGDGARAQGAASGAVDGGGGLAQWVDGSSGGGSGVRAQGATGGAVDGGGGLAQWAGDGDGARAQGAAGGAIDSGNVLAQRADGSSGNGDGAQAQRVAGGAGDGGGGRAQSSVGREVELTDISDETALIALQGPHAVRILSRLTAEPVAALKPFRFLPAVEVGGVRALVSRTGYTGEDGFELYAASGDAVALWNALLAAGREDGLEPAGLGARDTLRFEARLPLYGQELGPDITPLEAGLAPFVKLGKGDFIGRAALAAQQAAGIPRKLVGLELLDRGIPRHGYAVLADGRRIGSVTTGTQSPTLARSIGLALIEAAYGEPGTELQVDVRGTLLRAVVVATPFYKKTTS